MADTQTLYKLIILYMLDKVDFPLTNTQITHLVLEKEYTSYFVLQQTFTELLESGLILSESTHNNTQYRITPSGKETLSFFSDKISDEIKADIGQYFTENQISLKNEVSVVADYYKNTDGGYAARCQLREKNKTQLELTLTVPNREIAEAVCTNWKKQKDNVYEYLMDLLIQ
jgi:predicted transcriptional regulator